MSTERIKATESVSEPAARLPKLLSVKREKHMPLNQVLLTFEDGVEAWSVFKWVEFAQQRPPTGANPV